MSQSLQLSLGSHPGLKWAELLFRYRADRFIHCTAKRRAFPLEMKRLMFCNNMHCQQPDEAAPQTPRVPTGSRWREIICKIKTRPKSASVISEAQQDA